MENEKEEKSKKKEKLTLAQTLKKLTKDHGQGAIMRGKASIVNVDKISSGVPAMDAAIGIGGYPRGRMLEIFGPESSGKTTLALLHLAQVQRQGLVGAFIDVEHALDPVWAAKLGVDMEKVIFSQPDSGEQALDFCEALASTGEVALIVVDSVAALVPQKELDGDIDDIVMAGQARIMSKGCRKLKGILSSNACTILFINQIREKVGVMFGSPETTPGGKALKFYASCRVRVQRGDSINVKETPIGHVLKCKVVKNKVATPFRKAEFNIYYGTPVAGIDYNECLFNAAYEMGLFRVSGSNFYIGDVKIGAGKAATISAIKASPELAEKVRLMVYDEFKVTKTLEELTDEETVGFEDEPEEPEEGE